ncbi:hypothetical protein FJV46_11370 [Arthrobacter agilis]|uniref:hypothetical protein n=1 Tax=Arthrobacter agilis TaxID=37921 RepID=UPI000B3590CD|nr:hypothetical protein [Arthrobacter agilis]OUM44034.1 hypothetical protein B8W74_03915 [Arthrobacter agilis]PPB46412.1 hypothetical protein CI784_06210 [Arthrobacter agilis]TPV23933.1 hypothetical protein FJV46_11370 [Arthrobacter agilis]VDR32680.1 Uncharacterised protein [Arthrobacter agilis]
MSDVFWDAQEDDDEPEQSELTFRRPWWVTVGAVVDLLILLVVVPVGVLSLIPFVFLVYVFFAQVLVWISPVLVVVNAAILWWSVRRRQAATTALAALGIAFVTLAFVVVNLWQSPVVVLGVTLSR